MNQLSCKIYRMAAVAIGTAFVCVSAAGFASFGLDGRAFSLIVLMTCGLVLLAMGLYRMIYPKPPIGKPEPFTTIHLSPYTDRMPLEPKSQRRPGFESSAFPMDSVLTN